MSAVPARRLGGFYFWYYAAIGALVPYLGLYLLQRGLDAASVGLATGALSLTRVFAPYVWGWYADRHGIRMPIVRLSLGLALLCFSTLALAPAGWQIALIVLYGLLVYGTMGQFEVVTFAHLAADSHRYSSIRVWGSIGFIVVVLGLGPWFDRVGVGALPWWIAGMFLCAWLLAWRIPEPRLPSHGNAAGRMLDVLTQRPVAGLLLACLLAQVSFGTYYGFFSIFLEQHGYRRSLIGGLWALGVACEVAVFWWIPRVMQGLSLERLFLWAMASMALRWVLTVLCVDHPLWLALTQLLHGSSFGLYHLAAVNLIQRLFPPSLQGRGQAAYIGASYGLGGALGGWLSGALWAQIPVPWIWFGAAGTAVLGWVVARWGFAPRLRAGSGV